MSTTIMLGLIAMAVPAMASGRWTRFNAFLFFLGLAAVLCGLLLEMKDI